MNNTRKLEKETKNVFTHRLEGKNTGLSSKLDLQGYFRSWRVRRSNGSFLPPGDTVFFDLLLYEDGTAHYNFFKAPNFETYDDYFTAVIQKGKNDWFYKGLSWGIYNLAGDTIKIQEVSHASNFTARFTSERWFLIRDNHTLHLIAYGELNAEHLVSDPDESDYKFYPLIVIPPSIPWLKKEKFFWKNSSDWEQYMQMIKTHN